MDFNCIDFFERIEQARGSNEKKKLLKQLLEVRPEIRKYFELVFDTKTQFHLSNKSFEKIANYDKTFHGSYEDAGDLLRFFATGQVAFTISKIDEFIEECKQKSGNELIEHCKQLITLEPLQAKWITRILNKNLRLGVTVKTINKVLKELGEEPIKVFEVQLCGAVKNIDDWNSFPVMACVKYDGFRAIVSKKGTDITITSRQGKVVDFMPELTYFFKSFKDDFIIDGEILAKDFNSIQKRIGRKIENIDEVEGLEFRVFDILEYNGEDCSNLSQMDRTTLLYNSIEYHGYLKREEYYIVENKEQLRNFWDEVIERGEEGLILKELDKPYVYSGRKNWWKVKPIFENSFEVFDYEFGTGKNKDKISKLKVKDKSERVISGVGSGLTDFTKDEILRYESAGQLIGRIVDIEYNEISKNSDGSYSLRFPRFLKFRHDKNNADIIDIQ